MPCAEYLLSLETVDVNFPDEHGRTLLSQTIISFPLDETVFERVKFLVEKKGADVNSSDTENWSSVWFVLFQGSPTNRDFSQRLGKAKSQGGVREDGFEKVSPSLLRKSQNLDFCSGSLFFYLYFKFFPCFFEILVNST